MIDDYEDWYPEIEDEYDDYPGDLYTFDCD